MGVALLTLVNPSVACQLNYGYTGLQLFTPTVGANNVAVIPHSLHLQSGSRIILYPQSWQYITAS